MSTRIRICSLSLSLSLACTFDASGLGEAAAGPTGEPSASDASATASTGRGETTTAPATEPGTGSDGQTQTTAPTTDSTTDPTTAAATTAPKPPHCGDGVQDPGEDCDDGPDNGPSRPCTPVCGVNVCGDGYPLVPGEACDDGNDNDADACGNDCTLPPGCGDGKIDDGEMCDDGNAVDTDECVGCKQAHYGDGFVRANVESCDDGKESPTCNADCSQASCGDTKLNKSAGEVCDLGAKNGIYDSGCAKDCKSVGLVCGDGVVSPPEELCDTALAVPSGSCTEDCQQIVCTAGRGNCDKQPGNGCEIDLKSDGDHCNTCDNDCTWPKEHCNAGMCDF